jgi:hypothetical protein
MRRALLAFAWLALVACKGGGKGPPVPITYDSSCEHDYDCVPAPGCCPAPCTSFVINAREEARAHDDLDCSGSGPCPVAGPCLSHEYLCVQRTCRLVLANEPEYRPREARPPL